MNSKLRGLLALALSMALILGGCAGQKAPAEPSQPEPSPVKSLYDQGQELVTLMGEMAGSSQYLRLYTENEEMLSLASEAGSGDLSEPKAVYRVRIPETALTGILELVGLTGLSDLPKDLRESVKARAFSSIPTQLNALGGANVLAAASICTASKTFVSSETAEPVIYLYTYQNAVPAAVTFLPGEEGAVSATGIFILYDQFRADSPEDLNRLLGDLGVEIEVVTQ